MADEVRRSGRANKGHHTKNADALDEPVSKPKSKPKPEKKEKEKTPAKQAPRAQSVQPEEQDGEDDAIIRCVCGDQRDIRGRQMICCDKCEVWQHNKCLGLQEGSFWDDKSYYCEQCKPEDHVELLAAMARGEKPWARKKGSKPKARPSDIKPESEGEKGKGATPQPIRSPASTQAAAPTPTSVSASVQPSQEPSNGHVEQKLKRETPKSQPQSPLGEKRRHESVADKDTSSKKRRKSSTQHQEKSTVQTSVATDIEALPQKQRSFVEKLRDTLASMVSAASDSRGYRIPDGETAKSLATRFALQINHAAVAQHGEPASADSPYSAHFRSMMFNVKKNTILIDRLLSGSLTAQDFASMSPEEMASEEKQKEYAAMREANEKQMVLTEETGPRLRKTHKGEEIVGEENMAVDHEFRQPELRERESGTEQKPDEPQSPGRDGQTVVELPEHVGGRAPLSVDTSGPQPDSARRPSTNFDINSVFDKVRSPSNDQQAFLQRRQSSIRVHEKNQQGPGDDADVDRLLKGEDDDVEMTGYASDPTIVWQGSISMQSMEPFDAVARFIAGGDFGQVVPWEKLLSPKLPIQGRIESQKGDEYIRGLATSGSHDVGVLAINPVTSEGRAVMDHLYNYFHPRDRWGVVPVDKLGNDAMRDLYVIPIEPGGSNLPPFLDMLEYCTIETPRKEHMILLALIAKLPEIRPQLPQSQNLERYPGQEVAAGQVVHPQQSANGPSANGPSPSPVTNPHGPQYSPVSAAFPPGNYGSPFPPPQGHNGLPQHQQVPPPGVPRHHLIPEAPEILGPFIDAPVIVDLLNNSLNTMSSVDPNALRNLRKIVEDIPEARTDMNVLGQHLKEQAEVAAQAQNQK